MTEVPRLEDVPQLVFEIHKAMDWIKLFLLAQADQKIQEDVENVILSVPEAAVLTKYSEQTIRLKVMHNEIPSFKLGGKRMFNKADLLVWINENRRN
jgi:excisionase family DNA binding protein